VKLTVERIREAFTYNPLTGIIRWRKTDKYDKGGRVAGCLHKPTGYWFISLDGVKIKGHQVAWAHHYGVMPTHDIDHRDLDKSNNRIKNLRPSNKSNNGANRPPQHNNTSGYKGVFWHKGAAKWMVQIRVRNKVIYGGLFEAKEAAAEHYDVMAEKHFGVHARLNLLEAA
jgi:HNH endonuclease/AP2 domain